MHNVELGRSLALFADGALSESWGPKQTSLYLVVRFKAEPQIGTATPVCLINEATFHSWPSGKSMERLPSRTPSGDSGTGSRAECNRTGCGGQALSHGEAARWMCENSSCP